MEIYDIVPVPKPRMTRSDSWRKRTCVQRYWDFKDQVKLLNLKVNSCDFVQFIIPMPKSWSKKKKLEMNGKPHQQKPDWDNLSKALCDAIHEDDAHLWAMTVSKYWGYEGKIIIIPNYKTPPNYELLIEGKK